MSNLPTSERDSRVSSSMPPAGSSDRKISILELDPIINIRSVDFQRKLRASFGQRQASAGRGDAESDRFIGRGSRVKVRTTDISRMASAPGVIFEALREAIIKGDLPEGEVLRQDRIAKLFNVSRIPVREALARLAEQGLVSNQRYRGAVVSALSTDEIRDVFEFRALLEPEILRMSVGRLTKAHLKEAAKGCEAFAREANSVRWGQLNRDFHYSLYQDAGRPYCLQVIGAALDRVERYARVQLVLTEGMERARREHYAILEACMAGKVEEAATLTRDHILNAGRSLIAFLDHQARLDQSGDHPDRRVDSAPDFAHHPTSFQEKKP